MAFLDVDAYIAWHILIYYNNNINSYHILTITMVISFRGCIRLVLVSIFAMLHFDGHDQPHEACDEDGSGSMTYDEMLGVFRKFGTSTTLSLSSLAAV